MDRIGGISQENIIFSRYGDYRKFKDITGGNKDDGETRICMGKANIGDLKAYASPPSRWGNAHVWKEYYKAHAEAVAVKRGRAGRKLASRAISKNEGTIENRWAGGLYLTGGP